MDGNPRHRHVKPRRRGLHPGVWFLGALAFTLASVLVVNPGSAPERLTTPGETMSAEATLPPTAARSYSFDLRFEEVAQPAFITIAGRHAAGGEAAVWRFRIAPNYGLNANGRISVWAGSKWEPLGVVQDLTRRGTTSQVTIDAGVQAAVVRVGCFVFRTTRQSGDATSLTTLHIGSEGSAPLAAQARFSLSNITTVDLPSDSSRLAAGIVADQLVERYESGESSDLKQVAIIQRPAEDSDQLAASVHVGDKWHAAQLAAEPGDRQIRVMAPLGDKDIGERPLTVTAVDRTGGTTLSSQSRAQSVAPYPTTTVATEKAPLRAYFPDAITLQDGSILLAYRAATSHTDTNGSIKITRSTNQGRTWSPPMVVIDSSDDDRDPKLAQLRDGTVLLTTFRTDWSTTPATNRGTYVARSSNGGFVFDETVRIETDAAGAWQHAPAVELANGDVIQPFYAGGARLARSIDQGRTFAARNEQVVLLDTRQRRFREPNVVRLLDGELVMTIRTNDRGSGLIAPSVLLRSFDEGRSWSEPEATIYPTSSHHMLVTTDGRVLLTWGNAWIDGRPTYATLITHPAGPWAQHRSVGVLNTSRSDQANPSAIQRVDGSFLVFGFDVGSRSALIHRL